MMRAAAAAPPFFVGVNLPWLQYGCDFGANAWQPEGGVAQPDRLRRLDEIFARLASSGLRVVRWFVLCDGRCGIHFDSRGLPLGLDGFFRRDFDAGLAAASRHGLSLIPVLFDFLWFSRRRAVNGVVLGGRRALLARSDAREALLDRVVEPLLRAYGTDPLIRRWDLVNEPEWATFGYGTLNPTVGLWPRTMRAVLAELAAVVSREAKHGATVGLASPKGLSLLRGLPLNELQLHWYDRQAARLYPVPSSEIPVLLGEFPTRGSALSPGDVIRTARAHGYCGALGWSAAADDPHTGLDELEKGAG